MVSSSWSFPKPNVWTLKTPSYWLSLLSRACLNEFSEPLSWPSDKRKTEVTLLGTFRSRMVLRAKFIPLIMLVPPPLCSLLTCSVNPTKFCALTHFRGQTLWPLLLKVIMESLSTSVRVSRRTFIVYLTSYIFCPLIEPLMSMTQIRSTLLLVPPLL